MRRLLLPLLLLVPTFTACSGDDGDGMGTDTTTDSASGGSTGDATAGSSGTATGQTTGDCGGLSHAADIQPIWDSNCAKVGCHVGPTGAFGLVLEDAYDKIVDVPSNQVTEMMLVAPSDVDGSYLWHKVNGTQTDVGGGGGAMPADAMGKSLAELDPDAVATIRTWIECGAPP